MSFQFVLVTFLATVVTAKLVMNNCPPGPNVPSRNKIRLAKLRITGCPSQPCTFYKGNTYTINVKAIFDYTASSMPYSGAIVVNDVPLELESGDLCSEVTITKGDCNDIKPGVELTGYMEKKVPQGAPSGETTVRVTIKDDNGKTKYCGEIEVSVKDRNGGGDTSGLFGDFWSKRK